MPISTHSVYSWLLYVDCLYDMNQTCNLNLSGSQIVLPLNLAYRYCPNHPRHDLQFRKIVPKYSFIFFVGWEGVPLPFNGNALLYPFYVIFFLLSNYSQVFHHNRVRYKRFTACFEEDILDSKWVAIMVIVNVECMRLVSSARSILCNTIKTSYCRYSFNLLNPLQVIYIISFVT